MKSPRGYVPAIDGLRAVSVLAVLCFHAGLPFAPGGYLGVSVFFTISGFVITRSLLHRDRTRQHGERRVDLAGFYVRRVLRLLPAGLATIVAVAICAKAGWLPAVEPAEFRWTALNVANWYQLRSGADYAAVFAGGGEALDPLVHYWSLAIEEQFYVVWPLIMVALLRLPRRPATTIVGLATAVLAVATLLVDAEPRTIYFHTLARAPEVLVGCWLAYVVPGRPSRVVARWARLAGPLAFVAVVVAIVATDRGSGAWPYAGWLPLFGCVSAVVVLGACVRGPLASVLGLRPLVELGRISYGVYLFHWPVFVILLGRGWSAWEVATVGTPLAFGLAAASFHLVERRLTSLRVSPPRVFVGAGAALVAVLVVTAATAARPATTLAMPELDPEVLAAVDFAPVPRPSAPTTTMATAASVPISLATSPTVPSTVPSTVPPTTVAAEPLRVLVVGDSTAESLSVGLAGWALDHPEVQVSVAAFGACGLTRGGQYRLGMLNAALQVECAERHARTIPDALPLADVVVVLVTLADVWDRSWDGGSTWLGPADPEFRERLAADYAAFADSVRAAGVPTLLWLRPPVSSYGADGGPAAIEASFTDGTQAWIESVVAGLAERSSGTVAIADLRGWFEESGLADDPTARLDGTHFSEDTATRITDEWLVPLLERLPRRAG